MARGSINYGRGGNGGWCGWYRKEANRRKRAAKRLRHKRTRSAVFAYRSIYR